MSQENSQVASETASEQPTTETTDNSTDVSSLVAESKKYRKRSQDAEARLAELEKKLASAEEAKLKEKEDFKALYEKVSSENEALDATAQKWNKYEENRRNTLLEAAPEEERERLAGLDLDTLEYVTGKINSSKANAPEVAGNPRQNHKTVTKDWTTMDEKERRDNWADIIASAKNKN
jgi:chromosome segregation ATPase